MTDKSIDEKKEKKLKDLTSEENKIFSVMPRFALMLLLHSYRSVKIKDLSKTLDLTPGNIDHHLRILEENKLVVKKMQIFPKRLYATIEITEKGEKMFTIYLQSLKDILE